MNNDPKFERFLLSIGIKDASLFDMNFISIKKIDTNKFEYRIFKKSPWKYDLYKEFNNHLKNIISYKVNINYIYDPSSFNESYFLNFINDYKLENTLLNFKIESINIKNKEVFINMKNINKDINNFFNKLFILFESLNYNYKFKLIDLNEINKEDKDNDNIDEDIDLSFHDDIGIYSSINKEVADEFVQELLIDRDEEFNNFKEEKEVELQDTLKKNYEQMIEERRHKDIYKKGNYAFYLLKDIDSNSGAVDFNGTIFSVDSKMTKKGNFLYKAGIYDETGAIYCTLISNKSSLPIEKLKELKKGVNVRIKGKVDVDKFRKEPYVFAHEVDFLPEKEIKIDNFPGEKRVELHLHTNMSEMDGINNITDYCKIAKAMGHKAIGLTDHGVVQAFPEAQTASKKTGVKILYGCELYLRDDYLKAVEKPTDEKLKDIVFVCFDLETTGLSIKHDRITEFGAVKIRNGFVEESLDIIINPEIHIPEKIQEITKITDEMVKNEPTFKEIYSKIKDFIKGTVLVSHNLEFDYQMLNEAMIRDGFGKLENSGIDTLALSKYFYSDSMKHSLGALSKRLEINYDDEAAHRADYDADVLGQCFLALRAKFVAENNNITLKDIEKLPISQELVKHRTFHPYHVTVFAKNKKGLKDLYRIISESHTKYMGLVPITPRSLLIENRNDLLVGSACFNSEVFYSSTNRNLESLAEAVSFYDFIEIQPLTNYEFLINVGDLPNEEILKSYLMDIINEAKKQNKIIVATGDVHFKDLDQKIYRDIYIASKGVGRINHPLNPFYRSKVPSFENPDQYYRTTEEMIEEFKWLENEDDIYNFVITNTNKIADMCEQIQPIPEGLFTPKIENSEKLLSDLCYKTAHELYGENLPPLIENRLKEELHGIITNGFSVIYYIAHKLVKKANDDGFLVGSRGSVGSSFAATMAGITEVNPLPPHYRCPNCKYVEFYEGKDITSGFDLPKKRCPHCDHELIADGQTIPFQTFLGFKAEKVPDIDLNFPTDYQATAHNYTKVLLGENNVYRAGTISAVQEKTAFAYVKKDYYQEFLHIDPSTISNAYISALAAGCLDVKRTTGQHPGGIVVVPNENDILDFTPVQYPAGDTDAAWMTTHFDFHSIHDTILKLDMLGHVDPQALKMMSTLSNYDYHLIPFNDEKVLSLFSSDEALNLKHKYLPIDNGALGLPEFGTQFVRQMLRETNPKSFRDLLIISGLSHGTDVWNNNAQDLISQKIVDLRGVIGCRDDIMSYLITMNIDPHDAFMIMEDVRKGKTLKPEYALEMREHNVPEYYIESCNKIKYLFPKGHACAYVMMAIRVGYYKIYYPLEYYATFFTLRSTQYDIEVMIGGIDKIHEKLEEFKQRSMSNNPELKLSNKEEEIEKTLQVALEMAERGFKFKNIDIERSDASNFIVDKENNALIPPFKVLDGLGEKAGEGIVKARNEKAFISKEDLLNRGKITKTNLKQLEQLGVLNKLSDTGQLSLFDFSF